MSKLKNCTFYYILFCHFLRHLFSNQMEYLKKTNNLFNTIQAHFSETHALLYQTIFPQRFHCKIKILIIFNLIIQISHLHSIIWILLNLFYIILNYFLETPTPQNQRKYLHLNYCYLLFLQYYFHANCHYCHLFH